MQTLKITALTAALLAVGAAHAATDGTLGLTSTGESDIILVKQNAVQVSNVDDINLGTAATLSADAAGSDDICVFNSTTNYAITFTSNNGAFNLSDGGTNTLPYIVEFGAGGAPTPVVYNTAITGLTGDNTELQCSGGTNATFGVTVASADFNAAAPGTYQDTLVMTVTPE